MDAEEPLLATLSRTFGHQRLRALQIPVVHAMLEGRDVLAVLPTGAGKSLCFQLPALRAEGLTLVVTPLISLMSDQVGNARARGIAAASLSSGCSAAERQRVEIAVRREQLTLLYVAPERLHSRAFGSLLAGVRVSRVVVDEAHCISEWGHDFRPAYRTIGAFVRRIGRPPMAAFTATATRATRCDIETCLQLRRPVRVVAGVNRPNLWLAARRLGDVAAGAGFILHEVVRQRGATIVYSTSRRRAVRLAVALLRHGVEAAPYHAGLSAEVRARVQERFLTGRLRVVCATSAFGMGIDHSAVRLVCHLGLPPSLEAYVQEAGRAGRDGGAALCTLVTGAEDRALQHLRIASAWPSPRRLRAVLSALPNGMTCRASDLRDWTRADSEEAILGALRRLVAYGLVREKEMDGPAGEAGFARMPAASAGRIDAAALRCGRRRAMRRLEAVEAYVRSSHCLRGRIARYFGEPPPACEACDRCVSVAGRPAGNRTHRFRVPRDVVR